MESFYSRGFCKSRLKVFLFATILIVTAGASAPANAATRTSTATGGTWATGSTWVGGVAPISSDVVVIATTGTNSVTLDADATCNSLTINSGGKLSIGSSTLTSTTAVTNSGTLEFTDAGTLSITRNFTNNGVFVANQSTVILSRTNSQTVSGTSTLNFYNLTLTGSGTKTLQTSPGRCGVSGTLSMEGTASASTYPNYGSSSTLRYAGTSAKTTGPEFLATFAGSGGVVVDKGTGVLTLGASKTGFASSIFVNSGTFNLSNFLINRSSAGGSLNVAAGATLQIGGTNTLPSNYSTHNIDAASTINYSGTSQTVSVLNSSQLYGNLILSGSLAKTIPASVQTFAGNFTLSGTATVAPSAALTIGGTLNIGTGTTFTAGSYTHSIAGNFVRVGTFTAGTSTINLSAEGDQSISGSATTFKNLTISGSGTKTFTTRPTVSGIFSMEGSANVSTYATLQSTSTIQYKGNTSRTIGVEFPTTFAGSGGVIIDQGTGNTISLNASKTSMAGNLNIVSGTLDLSTFTMNRVSAGGTFTLAAGANLRIGGTNTLPTNYSTHSVDATSTVEYYGANQTVALLNSSQGYGNLILSGSGTKTLAVGTISIKGDFENNGITTSSTGNTMAFNGSTAQSIGGTSSSTFDNLTLNNALGVTLNTSQTANGVLDLTNGLLNTDSNTLTLGCTGSITNANSASYVNGKLAIVYCGTGSKVFHIGKGGNYRPLTLNYTSLTGSSTVTAEQLESSIPGTIPNDILPFNTRYWQLSQTGGSGYSFHLTLDGTDWSPTHYTKMLKGDGSTNEHYGVTTPNYTNSATFTSFGNFGLGELTYVTWLGTTSDWFTNSNWTSETPPASTDEIHIQYPSTLYPSISGTSPINDFSLANTGILQIEDGASLILENGPLLTFESGASVTTGIGSKITLKSGSRYLNLSTSTPTLEVQRELTGAKGWRMLSAPVASTYSDLFKSPMVTQGFTGSSFPTLQPNLLWWLESDGGTSLQSWRQPNNLSDALVAGRGYFQYTFDGAGRLNLDGSPSGSNYPDSLPKTISSTGVENFNGSGSYTFSLTYTPKSTTQTPSPTDTMYYDLNALDEGWNLLGNPTASTLNWDAVSGWTKTNVDNTIYVWDPSALSGNGDYLTWNGSTGTLGIGRIAPYQAFWVHANASPALSFDNDAKTSTIGTFLRNTSAEEPISLSIHLSVGDLKTTSFVSFSNLGRTGPDRWDAYRMESMSENRLDLFTLSSPEFVSPLVINNLPEIQSELVSIPLYYEVHLSDNSNGKDVALSWVLPPNWPSDWNISLLDHRTQEALSMKEHATYSFMAQNKNNASPSARSIPMPKTLLKPLTSNSMLRSSSTELPFSIVVYKGSDIAYLPPKPHLVGSTTNPFRLCTNVRFSLPEKARTSIEVYSAQGKKIAVLANDIFPAGITEIPWNASNLAPDLYLIRFVSGSTVEIKKAVLMH